MQQATDTTTMTESAPTACGRPLPEGAPELFRTWLDRTRAAIRAARSTETISRWVVEGKLHPRKVGGVILFDPDEIDNVVMGPGVMQARQREAAAPRLAAEAAAARAAAFAARFPDPDRPGIRDR